MAITIDIVDNASLDNNINGGTMTRTAHVYGLDAGATAGDPATLFRALATAGIPQWHAQYPGFPSFICNRQVITPLDDSSCQVLIYYVSGPGGAPGSTWLVTETTSPMQVTTQIHPANGQTMTMGRLIPNTTAQLPVQVCTFAYDIAVRRLTFEGWVSRSAVPGNSTPTAPANTDMFANAVNCVNSVAWRGYDIGYWKFAEWSDQTQDRGFSYTIRASFITKMREDWSQYQLLRSPNNGQIITPDAAAVTALRAQAYAYDWFRNAGGGTPNSGIVKAGLYPLTNFSTLFGD